MKIDKLSQKSNYIDEVDKWQDSLSMVNKIASIILSIFSYEA